MKSIIFAPKIAIGLMTISVANADSFCKDPSSWFSQAGLSVHRNDQSTIDGFTLNDVSPSTTTYQIGFRSGDILLQLNGLPLDTPAHAMAAFAAAKQRSYKFTIRRKNQPSEVVVDCKTQTNYK